jgi:hypothetical protein
MRRGSETREEGIPDHDDRMDVITVTSLKSVQKTRGIGITPRTKEIEIGPLPSVRVSSVKASPD